MAVLDSAADTDYDLITRDSAAEAHGDKRVIQFTSGRFRFKTKVWSSAADVLQNLLCSSTGASAGPTHWHGSRGRAVLGLQDAATNDPLGTGDTLNTRVIEFEEDYRAHGGHALYADIGGR